MLANAQPHIGVRATAPARGGLNRLGLSPARALHNKCSLALLSDCRCGVSPRVFHGINEKRGETPRLQSDRSRIDPICCAKPPMALGSYWTFSHGLSRPWLHSDAATRLDTSRRSLGLRSYMYFLKVFIAALTAVLLVLTLTLFALGQQGPAAGQGQGGQRGQGGGRGGGGGPQGQPARPTPRGPDGKPLLGPIAGEKGIWLPAQGGAERMVDPDNAGAGGGGGFGGGGGGGQQFPKPKVSEIPFQPWAKALYEYRGPNQLEPHTRCKPSGGPRQFLTPYGVEIVQFPDLQRIFIFDIGG